MLSNPHAASRSIPKQSVAPMPQEIPVITAVLATTCPRIMAKPQPQTPPIKHTSVTRLLRRSK